MRVVIIGVDPGKKTGVAHLTFDNDIYVEHNSSEVDPWQVTDTLEFYAGAADRVSIGCEKFTIGHSTAKKSAQPDALQVTGVVKTWAAKHNADFRLLSPGPSKRLGSRDLQRRIGVHNATKDKHAQDAMSHALMNLSFVSRLLFANLVRPSTVGSDSDFEFTD